MSSGLNTPNNHLPKSHPSLEVNLRKPNSFVSISEEINFSSLKNKLVNEPGNTRIDLLEGLMRVDSQVKLIVSMIGLPARGKSYIVKKLKRYLSWLGISVRIFNVGDKRRLLATNTASNQPSPVELTNQDPENIEKIRHTSSFFDSNNKEAAQKREQVAMDVLEDIIDWIHSGGQVGIHDATNSTIERRQHLIDRVMKESNIKLLFIESICTDESIINANIKMKLFSPDYIGIDPVTADQDFRQRLKNYESSYETLGEYEEMRDIQYCKIINVGSKITLFNINGFLEGQCAFYLMNMNLKPRVVYITRHGESTDNKVGRIGGDAGLSDAGFEYASALTKFITKHQAEFQKNCVEGNVDNFSSQMFKPEVDIQNYLGEVDPKLLGQRFEIWTSMLKRTVQTAQNFDSKNIKVKKFSVLNELYSGLCEGMTYHEIPNYYPNECLQRLKDKLFTRYPGTNGESYVDVVHRLQHIIVELERLHDSVLIVTHRAISRTLISYFMDISIERMPFLNIPLEYVFACVPKAHGNDLYVYKYDRPTGNFVKVDSNIIYEFQ